MVLVAVITVLATGQAHAAVRPPLVRVASGDIAVAATSSIRVYRHRGDTRTWVRLPNPGPYDQPEVLSVISGNGRWLHVRLPIRPNNAAGWVPATEVHLSRTAYHISIVLSGTRLRVYRGRRLFLQTRVAVGARRTPTPRGHFYITAILESRGFYGPYAFGLSAHSTVLRHFDGGDGQIGIHGTDQPRLIGEHVSHGCVRVPNGVISDMARFLPLGTPVLIR